jgi:hypothetical protein
MKFIFCVGGHFVPTWVDDPSIEHDSAIMIEDEKQTLRISLGMDRDEKLSKPYQPYFARVLSKDKMIYLRDALTKLIDECQ